MINTVSDVILITISIKTFFDWGKHTTKHREKVIRKNSSAMLFQRFLSYTLRKNLAQERSRICLTPIDTISVFDKHEYIKCSVHDSFRG